MRSHKPQRKAQAVPAKLRGSGAACQERVSPPALKQKLPQTHRHTAREAYPLSGKWRSHGGSTARLRYPHHDLPARKGWLYTSHTCTAHVGPHSRASLSLGQVYPNTSCTITAFHAERTVGRKKDTLCHVSPQYCCCRAAVLLQQAARWRPWCTRQPASHHNKAATSTTPASHLLALPHTQGSTSS